MTLRVIGAGLGRTGTHSLKLALEHLLGGPCYHMAEILLRHPEHAEQWTLAATGTPPDWDRIFAGYVAAVDSPPAQFWRELKNVYPEALVLLSLRDAESWWQSARETIFQHGGGRPPSITQMHIALDRMLTPDSSDKQATIAAYEAHSAAVMAEVEPERLLIWRLGDGWEPICAAL